MRGGTLDLHGQAAGPSWTLLSSTASAGSTTLAVVADISAWSAGDRLVIGSSNENVGEIEEVTVTSILGNIITINEPLMFDHISEIMTYGIDTQIDLRIEVANLTRNIKISGSVEIDDESHGGHIFVHRSETEYSTARI